MTAKELERIDTAVAVYLSARKARHDSATTITQNESMALDELTAAVYAVRTIRDVELTVNVGAR